jgi:hypothetical protein
MQTGQETVSVTIHRNLVPRSRRQGTTPAHSTVGLLKGIPKENAEKMGDLVRVVQAPDPRTNVDAELETKKNDAAASLPRRRVLTLVS